MPKKRQLVNQETSAKKQKSVPECPNEECQENRFVIYSSSIKDIDHSGLRCCECDDNVASDGSIVEYFKSCKHEFSVEDRFEDYQLYLCDNCDLSLRVDGYPFYNGINHHWICDCDEADDLFGTGEHSGTSYRIDHHGTWNDLNIKTSAMYCSLCLKETGEKTKDYFAGCQHSWNDVKENQVSAIKRCEKCSVTVFCY
jgi:hypothetical protein